MKFSQLPVNIEFPHNGIWYKKILITQTGDDWRNVARMKDGRLQRFADDTEIETLIAEFRHWRKPINLLDCVPITSIDIPKGNFGHADAIAAKLANNYGHTIRWNWQGSLQGEYVRPPIGMANPGER